MNQNQINNPLTPPLQKAGKEEAPSFAKGPKSAGPSGAERGGAEVDV